MDKTMADVEKVLQEEQQRNAEFREIERKFLLQMANQASTPSQPTPEPQLTIEYRISKPAIAALAKWKESEFTSRGDGGYLHRVLETREVVKCLESQKITGHVVFEI